MGRPFVLTAATGIACTVGLMISAAAQAQSPPRILRPAAASAGLDGIAKVDKALFRIECSDGSGSGFQYVHPGYVLTNRHVVESVAVGSEVDLRPVQSNADGSVGVGAAVKGTVRYKHPELDVAVIEMPGNVSPIRLTPVNAGGLKYVARGSELLAHGFPGIGRSSGPTISRGMLSAHYQDPLSGQTFYITDTALSPGSSGGPVTDSSGAVIGIATAVSIVVDGAGSSWGYVLPISSIEEALGCSKGFTALPKPFDTGPHIAAIRAATSTAKALGAFHAGARDAAKSCASPDELADALESLTAAVTRTRVPFERAEWKQVCELAFATDLALFTRLLEFNFLDADETQVRRLAQAVLHDQRLAGWMTEAHNRSSEGLSAQDRRIRDVEYFATWARQIAAYIEKAESHCGEMQRAVGALESDGPVDRKNIRAFAGALAPLMQAHVGVTVLNPDSVDLSDASLPPKARQSLRVCKAEMENCLEQWRALSPDCVEAAGEALSHFGANDATEPAVADDAARSGEADLSAGGFATYLAKNGWNEWGAVQRSTAQGGSDTFTVDFDEAPGVALGIVTSRKARTLSLKVEAEGADPDVVYMKQGDGICFGAVEMRSNKEIKFTFESADEAEFDYAFTVLYRPSQFGEMRESARRVAEQLVEVGAQYSPLGGGSHSDFTFDADEWSGFLVVGLEPRKLDIDIEVFDPDGKMVGSDVEADSFPMVFTSDARRGKYTVRLKNSSTEHASADWMIFGLRRN